MQALTRSTASSELIVADGELAPDLASTTRTTFPTPTNATHSPFPHRPRRRRGHYPRSTLAVTRGRKFVDIGNILRYWVHNYRLIRYLTPRPRRQTCPFETATCGAVSPFPFACATTTDLDPSHLKRRAAVLIDACAFPVRAPSTTSRNDAGTHSFPPTTMVPYTLLRRDAKPRSSSDAVAVVPRMCPTRDSQAWETGGSVLGATARTPRSQPLSFIPDVVIRGIFCDSEPPEAHVRTPRARDAKVKAPFILTPHSRRLCGSSRGIFANLKPPEARAGSLGEGCGRVFADPGLPEASAGSLGKDAKEVGELSADPKPPEACARTLDEGRDRGGVSLAPRHESVLLTQNRRRPARAPSVKDAGGVGYPLPLTTRLCEPRRAAGQLPPSKGALCSSLDEGKADHKGFACRYTRRRRCTPTKGACRDQNSTIQSFYADVPPFKRLETDIFDAKDPSPSSLPTSSRSTPTSQLSTTPANASRCVPRDVAD
ncbi:hypothetical protein EV121DRAFT_297477 [Schizophyllum commune]